MYSCLLNHSAPQKPPPLATLHSSHTAPRYFPQKYFAATYTRRVDFDAHPIAYPDTPPPPPSADFFFLLYAKILSTRENKKNTTSFLPPLCLSLYSQSITGPRWQCRQCRTAAAYIPAADYCIVILTRRLRASRIHSRNNFARVPGQLTRPQLIVAV